MFFNISEASISSTSGTLGFDVNADGNTEMSLSSNALLIGSGVSSSANLIVQGNAIISKTLSIGTTSSTSNLNIGGTIGFSIESISPATDISLSGANSHVLITPSTNIIAYLPDATNLTGRLLHLKNLSNTYSVHLQSNSNIENADAINLLGSSSFSGVELIASGNTWYLLSKNGNIESGPSFSANLLTWLDAQDMDADHWVEGSSESTVDATGNISEWKLKAGSKLDFAQVDPAKFALYESNSLNGKSGLRTTSTSDLRATSALPYSVDKTIFLVTKPYQARFSGNSNTSGAIIGRSAGTASINIYDSNTISVAWKQGGTVGNFDFAANSIFIGAGHIVTVTHDYQSQDTNVYLNGIASINNPRSIEDAIAFPINRVGYSWTYYDGVVHEVIVYNRILSQSERHKIENYLSSKWSVSVTH